MVRQLFLVVLDGRRGLKQASSTSLEAEIRLRDFKAFEWCQMPSRKMAGHWLSVAVRKGGFSEASQHWVSPSIPKTLPLWLCHLLDVRGWSFQFYFSVTPKRWSLLSCFSVIVLGEKRGAFETLSSRSDGQKLETNLCVDGICYKFTRGACLSLAAL